MSFKTPSLVAAAVLFATTAAAEEQFTVMCQSDGTTVVECPLTVSAADLDGIEPTFEVVEGREFAIFEIEGGSVTVPLFDHNFLGLDNGTETTG